MKIAIIDDYPIIRVGLEQCLNLHFENITVLLSDNILRFKEAYRGEAPEVLFLGLKSGAENMTDFIIGTLRQFPDLRVIVLEENVSMGFVTQYLNAGVNGYLNKSVGPGELVLCVESVMLGKRYLGVDTRMHIMQNYHNETSGYSAIIRNKLSRNEYEIARYLGAGMRISAVARLLGKQPTTISRIKRSVFKKLQIDNVLVLSKIIANSNPGFLPS